MKNGNVSDPFDAIFITHQIPKGLQVDEVFSFGNDHQHNTKVGVVGEEK